MKLLIDMNLAPRWANLLSDAGIDDGRDRSVGPRLQEARTTVHLFVWLQYVLQASHI